MLPPWLGAPFEMVEAELGFELLILRFDRPALMREWDTCFTDALAGRSTKKYFVRGVAPRSCSHKSQTSGANRRSRQSLAGVTRTAANRAAHGRFVPLRHVTRRHARVGKANANARTAIGRVSCTSTSCDRGRPMRPLGGTWTAGVPGNTVR